MRGIHPLGQPNFNFIWQLEAGIDISATPGTKETTSNTSDVVNGALFSRNSFIGFNGKEWGGVMIGKSETPYKTSTDRLNPFSGMLGDYRVMIGNTGGDNRVEFGLRASHAIWYESPSWERRVVQGDVFAGSEPRRHQQHRSIVGARLRGRQHSGKRCASADVQRRLVRRPVQRQRRVSARSALRDGSLRDAQERQPDERSRQSGPARCQRRERRQDRRAIHVRDAEPR